MKSSPISNLNSALLVTVSVIVGASAATVVIVVLWLLDNQDSATSSSANVDQQESLKLAQQGLVSEHDEIEVDSSSPPSERQRIQTLSDLNQFMSPFERSFSLHVLSTNSKEQQLVELLEESMDIASQHQSVAQSVLLQRLAQLNPQRALTQVEALNVRYPSSLVSKVFGEWAHTNVDEAVAHASSLEENKKHTAMATILLERSDLSDEKRVQIARQLGNEQYAINLIMQEKASDSTFDPEEVWNELVGQIEVDSNQSRSLSDLALRWVEQSGVEVLDQVAESITDVESRANIVMSVLSTVAETDPQTAFQYALTIDYDRHNMIRSGVVGLWARRDPKAALDAVSQVEVSGLRRRLEESVVRTWAYQKPHELLKDLNSLEERLHETAINSAMSAMARHNPDDAARFVASMENSTSKTAAAGSLAVSWSHQDPESALEWVLNEPGVQDAKSQLLQQIIYSVVDADPRLAMETALEQPIKEGEHGLEAAVIAVLVFSDFDKALEFLPQVRAGPTKIAAYGSIGGGYIENGETEKALDLAKRLPESSRTAYLQALMPQWAVADPKGLLDSMDQLPSDEIKSKAAMLLTTYNRWEKSLTDEEIESVKKFLTEEDAENLEKGNLNSILGF
ncbi:MAG: hypothetical protein OXG08_11995 [Gammaproteobacteria bacterium]|nr:hypothetical protein [Gammaproteobacteria bacterium]